MHCRGQAGAAQPFDVNVDGCCRREQGLGLRRSICQEPVQLAASTNERRCPFLLTTAFAQQAPGRCRPALFPIEPAPAGALSRSSSPSTRVRADQQGALTGLHAVCTHKACACAGSSRAPLLSASPPRPRACRQLLLHCRGRGKTAQPTKVGSCGLRCMCGEVAVASRTCR